MVFYRKFAVQASFVLLLISGLLNPSQVVGDETPPGSLGEAKDFQTLPSENMWKVLERLEALLSERDFSNADNSSSFSVGPLVQTRTPASIVFYYESGFLIAKLVELDGEIWLNYYNFGSADPLLETRLEVSGDELLQYMGDSGVDPLNYGVTTFSPQADGGVTALVEEVKDGVYSAKTYTATSLPTTGDHGSNHNK